MANVQKNKLEELENTLEQELLEFVKDTKEAKKKAKKEKLKAKEEAKKEKLKAIKAKKEKLKAIKKKNKTLEMVIPEKVEGSSINPTHCFFGPCKRKINDEWRYGDRGQYCSYTCEMFATRSSRSKSFYKKEFAKEDLFRYLRKCEEGHRVTFVKKGDSFIPTRRIELPTVAGYATYLGFSKVNLSAWAEKHDEFREALLFLQQIQEVYLTSHGVDGSYNPSIAKLLLMNYQGMRDREEKTVNNNAIGIVRDVYAEADRMQQEKQGVKFIEAKVIENDNK